MADDGESMFGLGHLAGMPITLTFGTVLVAALIVLIILRVAFGEIRVSGGAKV
jgi:hypothetical protein